MKHLLSTEHLSRDEILAFLERGEHFARHLQKGEKKFDTLKGKTIINWFLEASTRTRTSFEIAGKRLSADVINVSSSGSSMGKGETLLDTAKNLDAMGPNVIVMRHAASGSPAWIASQVNASIVNAGDGMHQHPTQSLLDCLTLKMERGKIEGLQVAIVGDLAHSRVARSNIYSLTRLGAQVRVAGPRTLMPVGIETLGVRVFDRVEPALEGCDVVMVLRLQRERMDDGLIPNTRDYSRAFGINARRLKAARPDALVFHPGPMNRGVEIEPEVADGSQSVILKQVTYGVAVRMAVLEKLSS